MLFGHDEGKNLVQLCDGSNDIICRQMGGTGIQADTAEELLLALGAISFKKVWENASPTSSFKAQEITVDWINDYDLFLTEFRLNTNSGYRFFAFSVPGATSPIQATMNVAGTTTVTFLTRNILFSINGYINVGACNYKKADDTATEETNSHLIPVKVLGIKGVK